MASTNSASTNLGIAAIPETKNPEIFPELIKIYNALHVLQGALDTYTGVLAQDSDVWNQLQPGNSVIIGNMSRLYPLFTQTVAAGQMINIYDGGGMRARLADATGGLDAACRAFATQAVNSGDFGEVILQFGLHTLVAGLTPGHIYYLGETPGHISSSKPTGSGSIIQPIGYALNATSLLFHPDLIGDIVP